MRTLTSEGSIVFGIGRCFQRWSHDNGTATLAIWALGQTDTAIWFQLTQSDRIKTVIRRSNCPTVRMSIVWGIIVTDFSCCISDAGPVRSSPNHCRPKSPQPKRPWAAAECMPKENTITMRWQCSNRPVLPG